MHATMIEGRSERAKRVSERKGEGARVSPSAGPASIPTLRSRSTGWESVGASDCPQVVALEGWVLALGLEQWPAGERLPAGFSRDGRTGAWRFGALALSMGREYWVTVADARRMLPGLDWAASDGPECLGALLEVCGQIGGAL